MDAKDHLMQTDGLLMATHINIQAGGATHLVKNYVVLGLSHVKNSRPKGEDYETSCKDRDRSCCRGFDGS